ncbi:tetratricopeptide repeat protein [Rubritalea marina]|uniref:tetratricopeptide repeat protein n=1 Tax=Rubritalea marina TaxID=361055 RepID=UPI00146138EF|nr:tetratricopeptide repeat protein [Rubritalea marina]
MNLLLGNGFALRTADQGAYADFEKENYQEAAEGFADAQWRGAAYFRAGAFKEAANVFSGIQSAEGYYNYGNSLVMLGKYQAAIEAYDRALAAGPDADASRNRSIAEARMKALDFEGGNMTDGKIGADGITFEQGKGSSEQDAGEEVVQGAQLDDAQMREVWLRKVQTKPADFLKVKFMYQDAARQEKGGQE